jgi:Tol biopolymer transport system component
MTEAPQQFGKYRILGELGRGGFATVFRAVDTTLEREVALKILYPQMLADPTFVQRFRQEARTLAALRHPQIVTVYEAGEVEGRLFIAMDLVNGPSLAQSIARRGRVPWSEVLALLRPVCEVLDYAHSQGVVHRDLKPANILLDRQRGALLTDFGFARLVGESSVILSMSGGVLGTPGYIAPEVWDGNAAEAPADIYALGCIAYELLTGEVLFRGQTPMQVMRAHDRGPQFPEAWPDGMPPNVDAVLRKVLARDPAARYGSAMALWHALNDLESQLQAGRKAAEQAAVVAQWRAETAKALAAGELSAARMALGRWLALAPNDPAALAAKAQLDGLESAPSMPSAPSGRGPIRLWALALGGLAVLILVVGLAWTIGIGRASTTATSTPGTDVRLIPTAPVSARTSTTQAATIAPTALAAATVPPPTSAPEPTTLVESATAPAATAEPTPTAASEPTATAAPDPTTAPEPNTLPGAGGDQIAFSSDRDDRRGELYLISLNNIGQIRLTNSSGSDYAPVWTYDGTRIAFASDHDGDDEIYAMSADGSGRVQLTANDTVRDSGPTWSPDGTRIAFASDRDRPLSTFDIYIMNADGSGQTRLTDDPATEGCPNWTPNGGTIAFARYQDGKVGTYIMRPDGSEQSLLIDNDTCPVWSPDGSKIAFTSFRDGNGEIYVMNADGSNQINLTNNSSLDDGPSWSPDGTRIAFRSQRDGNSEIYVMNADGSEQANVTNNPAGDSQPAWRPRR